KLERYERIQKVLLSIKYSSLSKHEKGIVIKFISKISGYSRQQIRRNFDKTKPKASTIGERKKA
ncbi:MAG: hypothetical protein ACI8TE_001594, partial [Francisella sp.]